MGSINETLRSINSIGNVTHKQSPLRELPWVLRRTVSADITQLEQAEGVEMDIGRVERTLMYAQRAVEIGYIFSEVFIKKEYDSWQPQSYKPRIIDLGGDPGAFSLLYWKHKAPNAQITAVEANPVTASVMRDNLARRGIEGVSVVNAAIARESKGIANLHLHKPRRGWHVQDYVAKPDSTQIKNKYVISVPTVAVSDLIGDQEKIDLLKMDIEGSEGEAVKDLDKSGKLKQIKMVIMEFHHDPTGNPQNSIEEMLSILAENGFSVQDAHITAGKGMRRKSNISPEAIARIAHVQKKIFLTFSAVRQEQSHSQ